MGPTPTALEIVSPTGVVRRLGDSGHPWALRFEPDALVALGGLPGAGKSILLERLSPEAEVTSAEAEIIARLGPEPDWSQVSFGQALDRVYERARRCLAEASPVIVESVALFPDQRCAWRELAARQGRPAHFVYLDCLPEDARRGQRERGRELPARVWRHYARMPEDPRSRFSDPGSVVDEEGWESITLIDRVSAAELEAILFANI